MKTIKNDWTIEVEKEGKMTTKAGKIEAALVENLITAKDATRGAAGVSAGYGRSAEFGREKYYIQVNLTCDQNEVTLARAQDTALRVLGDLHGKAEELFAIG